MISDEQFREESYINQTLLTQVDELVERNIKLSQEIKELEKERRDAIYWNYFGGDPGNAGWPGIDISFHSHIELARYCEQYLINKGNSGWPLISNFYNALHDSRRYEMCMILEDRLWKIYDLNRRISIAEEMNREWRRRLQTNTLTIERYRFMLDQSVNSVRKNNKELKEQVSVLLLLLLLLLLL